jgi:hypothetical protein
MQGTGRQVHRGRGRPRRRPSGAKQGTGRQVHRGRGRPRRQSRGRRRERGLDQGPLSSFVSGVGGRGGLEGRERERRAGRSRCSKGSPGRALSRPADAAKGRRVDPLRRSCACVAKRRVLGARTFLTTFRIDDDPTHRNNQASVIPTCPRGRGYGLPVWADGHSARGKGPRGSAHYTREAPRPAILASRGVRPGGETVRSSPGRVRGASLDGTPMS